MTVSSPYAHATSLFVTGLTWTTAVVKCALLNQSYVPTGAEVYFSDVNAYEISGAGYTSGGATLSGKTLSYDAAARTTVLTATNPEWAALTGTFRYAVFYVSTGAAGTSPLLSLMDFETARAPVAQFVRVVLSASGVLEMQVV